MTELSEELDIVTVLGNNYTIIGLSKSLGALLRIHNHFPLDTNEEYQVLIHAARCECKEFLDWTEFTEKCYQDWTLTNLEKESKNREVTNAG